MMSKAVLITGGSSGIGYELSVLFAKAGYHILWVAKPQVELNEAKQKLETEIREVKLSMLAKDLSEITAAKEVYDWTKTMVKQVDVLVNNAGFGTYGQFSEISLPRDRAMIGLNVVNVYQMTRFFLVDMEKRDQGNIINISSSASYFPLPNAAVYAGTKAFVRQMSNSIYLELKSRKSKVKVTTVCPGAIVNTPFQKNAGMDNVRTFKSGLASTTAQEVAKDAYRGMLAGKKVVRTGWRFRIVYWITKITPSFITNYLLIKEMEKTS